ncbi:MAG: ATP synthase F1 subunit delta [Bacteroidota bacterium]
MSTFIVARRYAQALYAQAVQARQLEAVDQDIDLIRETLNASRELRLLFESPVVPRHKKEAVMEQLFAERVQSTTLDFLRLLTNKKREDILPTIFRAYRELRDQQLGIVEATVRTAQVLTDDEEQKLRTSLEALAGSRVRLRTATDASLIGGIVVRLGDTVYDGSVQRQLERMREQLEQGSVPLN